jgi:hypothetical protein
MSSTDFKTVAISLSFKYKIKFYHFGSSLGINLTSKFSFGFFAPKFALETYDFDIIFMRELFNWLNGVILSSKAFRLGVGEFKSEALKF